MQLKIIRINLLEKIGLGKRNDVLEGNYGAGITDTSVDQYGNNLKERMSPSLRGKQDTSNLVYLIIPYYGDDEKYHDNGEMVVNIKLADEVLLIFQKLYEIKYPIHKMVLVDNYEEADDWKSIEDNNTSAFNYRGINGTDPSEGNLSNHAYGVCIDINPLINPYVFNYHSSAASYTKHSNADGSCSNNYNDKYIYRNADELDAHQWSEMDKKMRIAEDTDIYKIFTSYGWRWLNKTGNDADFQHFDKVDTDASTEQIDWSNTDEGNTGTKNKKKKDISLAEVIGGVLRDIWEVMLTFFEYLYTGREEQGVNFTVSKNGNIGKIDIDNFVYYYQGDPEWANRRFANGTFGPNGCGPSAVAMILTNMSGERITPNDVIDWCGDTYSHQANGHFTGGTNAFTMLEEGIKHFGLSDTIRIEGRQADPNRTDIPYASISDLIEILKKGNALILVGLSRGIFTNGGHYIVFAGTYDDGTVIVRDPGGNGLNGRPGVIDEPYNNHHFTEQELSSPNAGMVGYTICYLE